MHTELAAWDLQLHGCAHCRSCETGFSMESALYNFEPDGDMIPRNQFPCGVSSKLCHCTAKSSTMLGEHATTDIWQHSHKVMGVDASLMKSGRHPEASYRPLSMSPWELRAKPFMPDSAPSEAAKVRCQPSDSGKNVVRIWTCPLGAIAV